MFTGDYIQEYVDNNVIIRTDSDTYSFKRKNWAVDYPPFGHGK